MILSLRTSHLIACSFDRWYPRFRTSPKDKHTFESRVIELEDRFIDFLKQDGIRLPRPPKDPQLLKGRDPRKPPKGNDDDSWAGDDDDDNDEGASLEPFEGLERSIEEAVEELGGEVFPKLNWSSPRDAAWMGGGTLACGTPGEVFLLLKSSDFCQSDVRSSEQSSVRPALVLRKYLELNPSLEFRCFVRGGKLRFACQRDPSRFHPFLNEPEMKQKIARLLDEFIERIVVPRFDSQGASGFVADVYVEMTARRPNGKCWLMDLAPLPELSSNSEEVSETEIRSSEDILATPPHPLLTWERLFSLEPVQLIDQLLVVTNRNLTDVSEQKVLAMHRVPLDLVHGALTSETFEEGFNKLRDSQRRGGNSQDDSDD